MNKAVFCITSDWEQADLIAQRLLDAGFARDNISILYSDQKGIHTSQLASSTPESEHSLGHKKETKAPEGATTGTVTGGILGGTVGLLAGIGTLAIPGLGPFIAAGPIMATLSGMAVGGGLGLITGTLIGMGIPEYEAKEYEKGLKEGNVLMAVHVETSEEMDQVKELYKRYGGKDIATGSSEGKPPPRHETTSHPHT